MTTSTRAVPWKVPPARYGWAGIIVLPLLVLFGWGVWVWSIPALAVLVPQAPRDLRTSKEALS